jgi:PAS domain S-box-containing protein
MTSTHPFPNPSILGAMASIASGSDILPRLIEAAPVAIVTVNRAGEILFVNARLLDMFGYGRDELQGKSLEELIPERFRNGHRFFRSEYAENPHVRPMGSGLDLAGRRRDGSEFPIEAGLCYVEMGDDLIIMAALTDITRRKQTEEQLEHRVQERTREIERRRHVADSLREILGLLNSARAADEILDHIVGQASRLLGADAGTIYQLRDIQPAPLIDVRGSAGDGPVTDHGAGYSAQLAVPLKSNDEVIGGLMLYYREPRHFAAEEIELAVMFADQATLALENARLRAHTERAAVAAERNRIARDLHDSVTQTLFSASLIAEVLPRLMQRDANLAHARLEELRQLTRGALAEMRTLLLELRPSALMDVEIDELLRQLTEAARGRARIPVSLSCSGKSPLPPDVKVAFYNVAQEALNNVAKHARAHQVHVTLVRHDGCARLVVSDDGVGFAIQEVTAEHLGLTIMQERSEGIGARLTIQSTLSAGTQIALDWCATDRSQ